MHGWRRHDGPRSARVRFRGLPALAVGLTASAALGVDHDGGGGAPSSALVGYGFGGSYATTGPAPETTAASSTSRGYFSISGGVAGLYPGLVEPYVVSVYNPNNFQITVTSISTVVTSPASKCAASNLAVSGFSGHLVVPGKQTAHTTVVATMAHSTPNPCQGVIFTLHYTGVGAAS